MPMRLLSPQDLRTIKGNPLKFSIFTPHCGRKDFARLDVKSDHLHWEDMPSLQTKMVHLNSKDNLSWILVRTPKSMEATIACFQASIDVTSKKNKNLNLAQKELLKWHQRLGHASFSQIQWLARSGKLPLKNAKAVGNCTIPICASCQFAKQKKRPTKAISKTNRSDKELKIKKNDLFPGQNISTDHYQSAVPGRTYSSRGSYHPEYMFNGGFFDISNTWNLIPKSNLPKTIKVIPTTWAMKIKRFPNRAFRSFKARFCVRGDLQKKAVTDIDTLSPVVQWSTVCLMLIISVVL